MRAEKENCGGKKKQTGELSDNIKLNDVFTIEQTIKKTNKIQLMFYLYSHEAMYC